MYKQDIQIKKFGSCYLGMLKPGDVFTLESDAYNVPYKFISHCKKSECSFSVFHTTFVKFKTNDTKVIYLHS